MAREEEVERRSLKDLERITKEAAKLEIEATVIGGYAVRAYTRTRLRYSKDLDLAVRDRQALRRFKAVLARLKYTFQERKHGLSGYKDSDGVNISLNVIVEDVGGQEREIEPYYKGPAIRVRIAALEELLILKEEAFREKDIVDLTILLLDAYQELDIGKLKRKLARRDTRPRFIKRMREITRLIGSKSFRAIWLSFMGRKIQKQEEQELFRRITELTQKLEV